MLPHSYSGNESWVTAKLSFSVCLTFQLKPTSFSVSTFINKRQHTRRDREVKQVDSCFTLPLKKAQFYLLVILKYVT